MSEEQFFEKKFDPEKFRERYAGLHQAAHRLRVVNAAAAAAARASAARKADQAATVKAELARKAEQDAAEKAALDAALLDAISGLRDAIEAMIERRSEPTEMRVERDGEGKIVGAVVR